MLLLLLGHPRPSSKAPRLPPRRSPPQDPSPLSQVNHRRLGDKPHLEVRAPWALQLGRPRPRAPPRPRSWLRSRPPLQPRPDRALCPQPPAPSRPLDVSLGEAQCRRSVICRQLNHRKWTSAILARRSARRSPPSWRVRDKCKRRKPSVSGESFISLPLTPLSFLSPSLYTILFPVPPLCSPPMSTPLYLNTLSVAGLP